MRYIESFTHDPYFNLALEEYVFTSLIDDDCIMLWQNDKTVVVGKYQNTIEEINPEAVKEYGLSVVRRNTGGGAVYHDLGNLNFSFITDWHPLQSYETFLNPVIKGLDELGIHASISGRNDLAVEGYKISGNAQRVQGGRILHHGTLLIRSDLEMLGRVLNPNPAKIQSKGIKSVKSRVTNLSQIIKGNLDVEDVKGALKKAFFVHEQAGAYILNSGQLLEVEKLAQGKYHREEWNYGQSPPFNFRKTAYFKGGLITVELFVEQGRIEQCKIYGDFLALADIEEVEEELKGCVYKEGSLRRRLEAFQPELYFGGILPEEVQSCFF